MSNAVLIRYVLSFWPMLIALHGNAQERWSVELRPALNIPVRAVNGETVGTGPGIEANVAYMYTPQLGVQFGLGYGQFNRFGTAGEYYEELGTSIGLRFLQPLIGPVHGMLGAGTVYHRLSMKEGNGQRLASSEFGFGWQVEGGLAVIFDERWALTPSVRYRSLSGELTVDDAAQRIELDYISAALAFAIRF